VTAQHQQLTSTDAQLVENPFSSRKTKRDPVIDGLKLVAAGGIVMVHVALQPHPHPLSNFVEQVSYSALYFFFLVAGYFHGALGNRGVRWLGRRFTRLAIPYYVWSLVFVAWWTVYHFIRHWPQPWYFPDPIRFLFFAGAAEILWSLPWLFACAVIAETFVKTPALRRALLVVAAIVQLAVYLFVTPAMTPNWAIRQYIAGARWVFMYLAGMEVRSVSRMPGSAGGWTVTAIAASVAAGTVAWFAGGQPTTLVPEIVLFALNGLVAVSLLAGTRTGAKWFGAGKLAWGGDYLLGIYVTHGLWLAMLARVISVKSIRVSVWLPVGWLLIFGVSLGVTHLLLRNRYTRLVVT
jgi:peptidoglycan/LPS O-acetylase OafA/YrhL